VAGRNNRKLLDWTERFKKRNIVLYIIWLIWQQFHKLDDCVLLLFVWLYPFRRWWTNLFRGLSLAAQENQQTRDTIKSNVNRYILYICYIVWIMFGTRHNSFLFLRNCYADRCPANVTRFTARSRCYIIHQIKCNKIVNRLYIHTE
jgi:hypothetical protein